MRKIQNTTQPGNDNCTSGVTTQEPPAVFRCSSPSLLVTDQERASQPSHEFMDSCLSSVKEEEPSEKFLDKMEEDEPSIDSVEKAVNLNTLPPEVLVNIQSYLDPRSNNKLRRVCRSLRDAADPQYAAICRFKRRSEAKEHITITLRELRLFGAQYSSATEFTLDLPKSYIIEQELQNIVERFPNITGIKAHIRKGRFFTYDGITHLNKLLNLRSLHLYADFLEIKDDGLADLSRLQNLTHLTLNRLIEFDRRVLLSNLPNLRSLDITSCTNDDLAHVSQLKNLTSLTLDSLLFSAITGDGLAHLSNLPNLANLDLTWCYGIKGHGLAHLSQLQNLTHLALHSHITEDSLVHLNNLQNLATLDLGDCYYITDDGINLLKQRLQNLKIFRSCRAGLR